jgi:phosphoribosylanthranilate isomerase
MTIAIKFCGLRTPDDVASAVAAGARYVGFVFFKKSPRHLRLSEARALAQLVPMGVAKVALVVNADNDALDQLTENVPIDMLQLHGTETTARVIEIKARYGLPVMKAVGVADASDLPKLVEYAAVCDQLLIDAKPATGAELPGGNGVAFDWRLIAGRGWPVPWMLAGGLTPQNVAEAVRLTGARQVDVSSGVEYAPGVKDAKTMDAFAAALREM